MRHKKIITYLPIFHLGEQDSILDKKIERHLGECPSCKEELNSLKTIFKELEKHTITPINPSAFERTKNAVKRKIQLREYEQEERIGRRLLITTSILSLSLSILFPLLIFEIVSPIVHWPIFSNFIYFFALLWGIFCFLSIISIPIVTQIRNIYFEEEKNGTI